VRFVVDVNLSPEWASLLAGQGHDAVHWRDVGPTDAPDDDIIAWAVQELRVVLTADLDFAAAVATRGLTAPSVVQLRLGSTDPLTVGSFVIRSITAAGTALGGGAILTIDPGQARLRPGFGVIS
jgi:predicted nuclease of predicted toxin-antitoxin system